ncbi:Zinc finger, RING-type [Corchorus olitorius]|uniref:Zinc finger, RING-type n=1 Tax=Corchorus olitorius TaxID=93759 RepID=A0A1R3GRQ1_9ROSI|nr:Zinc finger, RING-type [Corchorus olitorius]
MSDQQENNNNNEAEEFDMADALVMPAPDAEAEADRIRTMVSELPTVPSDDICSIFHDDMEQGKQLSCNHVFHQNCIANALIQSGRECPLCRASV